MAEAKDYGEPWVAGPTGVFVTRNRGYADGDEGGENRILACVNALAGVPDETLSNPSEGHRLALAVLRGDCDALVLADHLQEDQLARANADALGKHFVPRIELVAELRGLMAAYDEVACLAAAERARLVALIADAG